MKQVIFLVWLLGLICSNAVLADKDIESGTNSTAHSGRVIGGSPTPYENFPFVVSLRRQGAHFCGGSVVSQRHVLTAVHCVYGLSPFEITVVGGTTYSNRGGVAFPVSAIAIHPSSRPLGNNVMTYDAAVLTVNTYYPMTNYNNIRIISLQTNADLPPTADCTVIGWGRTSTEMVSTVLQKAPMRLVSGCTPDTVCAMWGTYVTACSGDSGGPLICDGKLTGIVSYGDRSCNGNIPTNSCESQSMMKAVIGLVLLGLFCGSAVQANDGEVNGTLLSGRIIKGVSVSIASYKFVVSLRQGGKHICGATVVSLSHAVTAGHCVYNYRNKLSELSLYGGSTSPTTGGTLFAVTKLAIHPSYNPYAAPGTSDYDAAVLTVATNAFKGKTNIAPIALQTAEQAAGTRCYVVGWGYTNYDKQQMPTSLQYTNLDIVTQQDCTKMWAAYSYQPVTAQMICAKYGNGVDTCKGDSGGPFICGGLFTGIVSFTNPSCNSLWPAGFAKIVAPSIRDFIKTNTVLLGLFCGSAVHADDGKVNSASHSGRIINGINVSIANYKFVVSLRQNGIHICGATVVSLSHAVTAGHCVYNYRNKLSELSLYGGSTSPTTGGTLFPVSKLAIHPSYNPNASPGTSDYDAAVLTVATNAFSGKTNIAPIALQTAEQAAGTRCYVVGWGWTNYKKEQLATSLQYIDLDIVTQQDCTRMWAAYYYQPVTAHCELQSTMKAVIVLVLLGLFCGGAVQADDGEVNVASQSGRIINGVSVTIASYKFVVSLRANGIHICGATVVSLSHAVTAGHCVYDYRNSVSALFIYGGSTNPLSGGTLFPVTKVAIHSNYNLYSYPGTSDYDAAVLTVATNAFKDKTNIAPIALQTAEQAAGTRCYVVGWGWTSYQKQQVASNLQYTNLDIVTQQYCASMWASYRYQPVTAQMICAKYGNGVDTCKGDSGGPFICGGKFSGIVSFTNPSCNSAWPAGFAKIVAPSIRSFIKANTVIGLVLLGLFCGSAVQADDGEANVASQSGRIINGVSVSIASYKFVVSLRANGIHNCGATVVTLSHAVTAGHCVYNYRNSVSALSLYGGSTYPYSGGTIFGVTKLAIHPSYNPNAYPGTSDFDAAVLTVATNAFSGKTNIAPIALQTVELPAGTRCYVVGWGWTNYNQQLVAGNLQYTNLDIVTQQYCASMWAAYKYQPVTAQMICAKYGNGVDTCKGDSGGPFICGGRLSGIVSFTNPNCNSAWPAGFAKIVAPSIRSFIKSVTGVIMKAVIGLVLLGLFCGGAVQADDGEANVASQSGRIIKGVSVNIANYKFVLSLRANDNPWCGAIVVTLSHAVTAGSCVYYYRNTLPSLTLLGGSTNPFFGGYVFLVSKLAIHPSFNPNAYPGTSDFNVAILTVATNAFSGKTNIAPIALQTVEQAAGTRCYVVGWGFTNYNQPQVPNSLQYTNMDIVTQQYCATMWAGYINQPVTAQMICAKYGNGVDTCKGDSGGPFVCGGKLTGIISFTNTYCNSLWPAGFVKIVAPSIRSFIKSVTGV
uniref:Peptidase S1 domain-containing protein n=1 Tax=Anopheles dirus TaxID=7168 RepID=A0A182NPH5_9DIPT